MANISIESFIAGFAYGGTTVLVGQPFETLKTLTQVQSKSAATNTAKQINTVAKQSLFQTATNLYSTAGIRGFYRGGVPLLLGGGLMRSAQFGVCNSVLPMLDTRYGKVDPSNYWFGCVNPHVVISGWAGGIGRGLVEGPFEMVKVRRQVVSDWQYKQLLNGFGTTMFRNSFLFSSFVIYMDIFRQQIEERFVTKVSPFIKAGTCASMAWLTIWPIDVIKTRRQSGRYEGSIGYLLTDVIKSGHMYKGLGVGLLRGFIANGASMEVYSVVEKELKRRFNN